MSFPNTSKTHQGLAEISSVTVGPTFSVNSIEEKAKLFVACVVACVTVVGVDVAVGVVLLDVVIAVMLTFCVSGMVGCTGVVSTTVLTGSKHSSSSE